MNLAGSLPGRISLSILSLSFSLSPPAWVEEGTLATWTRTYWAQGIAFCYQTTGFRVWGGKRGALRKEHTLDPDLHYLGFHGWFSGNWMVAMRSLSLFNPWQGSPAQTQNTVPMNRRHMKRYDSSWLQMPSTREAHLCLGWTWCCPHVSRKNSLCYSDCSGLNNVPEHIKS